MKKLGIVLIVCSLLYIAFYYFYNIFLENKNDINVNKYIEDTTILNIEETTHEEKEETIVQNNFIIPYTAVLEIPKINLKRGVVDNTKNFNSINYAISVDNSSNYPNVNGNFILYAHSGNSSIAFFRDLYRLDKNDNIYVYYNGVKYEYKVNNKYDIQKTGKAKVLKGNNNRYITLITCNQNKKGFQIIIEGVLVNIENY